MPWYLIKEIIGLQTPRGRLFFFAGASIIIFVLPYNWLNNLSLWQLIGIPLPSIGLTRAYWLTLHGNFGGAWQRNGLIFLVLGIGIALLLKDVYTLLRRSPRSHTATGATTNR